MAESISLGWNCGSACYGVDNGIRSTKQNGYKTCPFDEMLTNYNGIVECIKDGFDDIYNTEYLDLLHINKDSKLLNTTGNGDIVVYHKKYKFIFNHESPGHANLYMQQKWKKGINHYILNNYEEFINRYKRRCENIKNYLNSNLFIHFIITKPNCSITDMNELNDVIKLKYPNLKFDIILLNCDETHYNNHMRLMLINI
jgi:hypothetical protein